MQHYITEIKINQLRHLSDISISLNTENRQHLIITGKNGSGKTSLLLAVQKYLQAINDGKLNRFNDIYIPQSLELEESLKAVQTEKEKYEIKQQYNLGMDLIKKYRDGVDIRFNESEDLDALYSQGEFVTAFFPANRKTEILRSRGVEDIKLNEAYSINSEPGKLLHKYMVHLKTQQSYARNEGDLENAERIQAWFDRFVDALKTLLDAPSITLEYNYKEYDFKICEKGRTPFGLDELSDGYSSVIHIVSDLMLRMDKNWILGNKLSSYDAEGIVLIDELETHLHIELQRKILPFLIKFFPRIQFIVTTHSPYILNSVSNAKAYDLERCIEMEDLSSYSAEGLAEGYFDADEYSDKLRERICRYQYLKQKEELTDDERAERAKLRIELKNIPRGLSGEARERFEEIEGNGL